MKGILYIGETPIDELPEEVKQEKCRKMTEIYANQVMERLMTMIEENDPRTEEYYNEICKCIVKGEVKS